jgi:hypothetical protein
LIAPAARPDAVADRRNPPELLAVEMDHLAGPRAFVAHHRRLGVERGQLAQPEPAQHRSHGRDRHAELAGDCRPAQALPPQSGDRGDPLGIQAVPAAYRRRAAVPQRRRTTAAIPRQPAIPLPLRYAGGFGRLGHPPTHRRDPLHQQESTLRRQPRILVNVHPGVCSDHLCEGRNPQPDRTSPDEQPS